jgi:glycosyltransferase involved in cell wall biosynthesis
MLIGFEASALRGPKSGVGYYTESMLAAIMQLEPQHNYVLFSNREMESDWKPLASESVHIGRGFPVRAVWMQAQLPGTLRRVKPDLCHFTNYLAPLSVPCPYVVTMYDMSVFLTPRMHSFKKMVLDRTLIPHVARRAGAILTISQSARRDILKCLRVPREKVRVVMGAASPRFQPVSAIAQREEARARAGLTDPYILYVGTIEPRKNLPRLVQAFAQLKREGIPHKLAIVGQQGWQVEPLHREIARLGIAGDVVFSGYVPADDLPALYSAADAMAFPSLYEGFGLPVIEAMACGAPVVTSNSSSLTEVAGDAAMLIDPLSVESIAGGLRRVLCEPGVRDELARRGPERASYFTWEKTARATISVYESVAARAAADRPRAARKVSEDRRTVLNSD